MDKDICWLLAFGNVSIEACKFPCIISYQAKGIDGICRLSSCKVGSAHFLPFKLLSVLVCKKLLNLVFATLLKKFSVFIGCKVLEFINNQGKAWPVIKVWDVIKAEGCRIDHCHK